MNVGAWLAGLGLAEYVEAFAENGIDAELLADLTNDDLKDLGIARVADRKRLLKAIAALSVGERRGEFVTAPVTMFDGDRRQVTVLFADLSGFTRLSSELGAETTHDVLNRYFNSVDAVVESYGGTVDKHIGDNVMAVFGAPTAHTDDPERAVRAALDIHQAMAVLSHTLSRDLTAHIGIASGQVIASGTGSDAHREYTVTGDSVNLASHLDDLAEPGETLISEAVHKAVQRVGVCSPRGKTSIKGLDRAVEVWAVHGIAAEPPTHHLAAFVGRRGELRQFTALLEETLEHGKGHSLVVRGEPGIGKTRLVEEFRKIAEYKSFAAHRAQILNFGMGKEHHPISALVASVLGVARDGGEAERRAAVQSALNGHLISKDRLVHLNDVLGLPQPVDMLGFFDAMDSATRKRGTSETLVDLIASAAARGSILITVEDIHWADDITLDHLASIARAVANSRALLIMTSRVEGMTLEQSWLASLRGCPLTTIELQPLRLEEATAMAESLRHGGVAMIEPFVARAEGNPLFLEQLMQNAVENAGNELPSTLQGLVLARIDRLDHADREAALAASVLGQRFAPEALGHLLGTHGYTCTNLMKHRIVRREGQEFMFSHALVREGIYASLLQRRRRDLHALAADFFLDNDKGLHAEHLGRAGSPDAPRAYLAAASEQAGQVRYENALQLVGRALEIAPAAESFTLLLLKGELLRNLGSATYSMDAYRGALEVASSPIERCRARIGIAEGLRLVDDHVALIEMLDRAEEDVGETGFSRELARIHQLRGGVHFIRGEIDACLRVNRNSLEAAREAGSAELEAQALGGLGEAEFAHGRMVSAHDYYDRCIRLGQAHNFARIVAANLSMRGQTLLYRNELDAALDDCVAAAELAVRIRQPRAEMIAAIVAAYVLESRDPVAGREWAARSRDIAGRIGSKLFDWIGLEYLARFAAEEGDLSEARTLIERVVASLRETESGMRFIGARSLGCMALLAADAEKRRAALREGEDLLRRGAPGHNYLWFYRDAMEACLRHAEWSAVEAYAEGLTTYTKAEPLPWCDFFIARGRALALFHSGQRGTLVLQEIVRLRDQAGRVGLNHALLALQSALSGKESSPNASL